ncbi:MAG: hypothetical protein ACR2KX_01985 [Chitinophagaceae bacterium]
MKKLITIVAITAFITACNGSETKSETSFTDSTKTDSSIQYRMDTTTKMINEAKSLVDSAQNKMEKAADRIKQGADKMKKDTGKK